MKHKKAIRVKYSYVNYEQLEWQERLDAAFDVIFDELELDDGDITEQKDEYEHAVIIRS